ncbi:VWA domain-containing protein [Olsenella sp. SW781]|uniref:vWA domain-containing protein n=1 Tax=Olsenella sp. SW781 TaxID=2530046 RepID=UPI0014397CF6|nr:vWA domain-containing protein [Olsenella sp. SW781]NJE81216.1 VWA domain-containing protein [Olsenella sp. SW781]
MRPSKPFQTMRQLLILLTISVVMAISAPLMAFADEASRATGPVSHNAIVLVLDNSGSMSGAKAQKLEEAAQQFSEKILEADPRSQIAIVSFGSDVNVLPFTSDLNELESFVENDMNDWGSTDVTSALKYAHSTALLLQDTGLDQYAKSIVTMSDGMPNSSSTAIAQAETMFPSYNMYSVGFMATSSSEINFLKAIQNSGYFEADDLDSLIEKFVEIAEELLNPVQISLSHTPIQSVSPDQLASYRLSATITNPNSKAVQNLTADLALPGEATLQSGELHQELGALLTGQSVALSWDITVGSSAVGEITYSVTAGGSNIVNLTQSEKIVLEPTGSDDNQFVFGTDNWSFANSSTYFGSTYYLNSADYNALLSGLSNSEKQNIKDSVSAQWGGSCYGFAASSILSKMEVINPLLRQPGASSLYDMTASKDVQSYINYCMFTQMLEPIREDRANFVSLTDVEKVNLLKERVSAVATGGSPVLLGFNLDFDYLGRNAGHAIVGDRYDSGSYTLDSGTYDGRIRYYDSNDPDGRDCYIYVNTETGAWDIPDYGETNSASSSADLTRANNDLALMNTKDIETSVENYKAILRATSETNFTNAVLRFKNMIYSFFDIVSGKTDLVHWFDDQSGSGSPLSVVLPDNSGDYTISSPDGYGYSLQYADMLLSVDADSAESASFTRSGSVSLEGNSGAYSLQATSDDAQGELYTFGVRGSSSGNVALIKTAEGYVAKADSLDGAVVTAEGDNTSKELPIEGERDELLISSDGTDITASADEDGDGTFETVVASTSDDNQTPPPSAPGGTDPSDDAGASQPNKDADPSEGPDKSGEGTPNTGDVSFAFAPIIAAVGVIVCAIGAVTRALLGHGRTGRDGSVNS